MKKLFLVSFLLMYSTANAAQVMVKLPEDPRKCTISDLSSIERGAREVAFASGRFLGLVGGYKFFDLDKKCVAEVLYPDDRYAHLFDVLKDSTAGTVFIATAYQSSLRNYLVFNELHTLEADEPDYYKWKEQKTKVDKEERIKLELAKEEQNRRAQKMADEERRRADEERRLNATILMRMPEYTNNDANINVIFDGNKLTIENKTSHYVTVSSISTYLNNKIFTISNLSLELPPEGYNIDGYLLDKLLSKEMHNLRIVKVVNIDNIKAETTKFGFAIKYKVNDKEYSIYNVRPYKNAELLSGVTP